MAPPILVLITLTSGRCDVAYWHIASSRCAAEFSRGHSGICRSVADVQALSLRHLYEVHQLRRHCIGRSRLCLADLLLRLSRGSWTRRCRD